MMRLASPLLLVLLLFLSGGGMAQSFIPGQSYLDSNYYVEYLAGNLPFVISVPHGGYFEPASIPDRNCSGCVYLRDAYTQELARELRDRIISNTGCYPHMVINLLHRKKFDANRDIGAAADGNAVVEKSWFAYHEFLDSAKAMVERDYGRGLFFDLHGHAHTIQRLELGYTLSKTEIQLPDSALDDQFYVDQSSIRALVGDNRMNLSHSELLRGKLSLGTLFEQRGYPAVPSLYDPFPLSNEPYFNGGYNTRRHSSLDSGSIDGVQIECNQSIRFNVQNRLDFGDSLAEILFDFYELHFDSALYQNYCNPSVGFLESRRGGKIVVSPNPVKDQFRITPVQKTLVWLYNAEGKRIKEVLWKGDPINIESLPSGPYFLFFPEIRMSKGILLVKE